MFNNKLFAGKLAGIKPYAVNTGKYAVRLDANESYFALPKEVSDDFARVFRKVDLNRYPDPDANALCEAFGEYYGIRRETLCAGNGSDEIISILMNGFADKGDTVMTFTPDFSMYAFYAGLAELEVLSCPKDPITLQVDFERADAMLTENKVRFVIFSNPCNPTGRLEKKADIALLAEKHKDTLFVVDEAYMDFAACDMPNESFLKDVTDYENIIVLKTLSKALGAAALRCGFVVADPEFIGMFSAVKSPYNVNSITQAYGEALLCHKELLRKSTQALVDSRKMLVSALSEMHIAPIADMYTNFVYFETPRAKEIYEALAANGILVRYFSIGGGALRITAGSPQENEMLIKALKDTVAF